MIAEPGAGGGSMACTAAMLLGAYYYTWYGFGEQWQVTSSVP